MRVSTIAFILTLAAGALAGAAIKHDDAPTVTPSGGAGHPTTTPIPKVADGRCTPCNDHMEQCMGKWPCWFYNCQPDCNHEVCEQLPDCRQGCGFHC
ncbi:hypothetical protein DPSP01_008877 [Paraphaeosphaeria sporulosa]